jgi:hypothetical protein
MAERITPHRYRINRKKVQRPKQKAKGYISL